jgi:hypothetical protein
VKQNPRLSPALPRLARLVCAAAVFALAPGLIGAALAQNEPKPDPQRQGAGTEKKADEFAEAARVLNGPAGNPECVWLGRRVVNLLWRDDLDTAFRHIDLYDRFGCPGGHIQATFRCVVRQGAIDPKAPESLSARVHQCWINPALQPQAAAAPAAAPPPGGTTGTNQQ